MLDCLSLAFKRRLPQSARLVSFTWSTKKATDEAFREVCSEILALGHPEMQTHPNIVQPLAISWPSADHQLGDLGHKGVDLGQPLAGLAGDDFREGSSQRLAEVH